MADPKRHSQGGEEGIESVGLDGLFPHPSVFDTPLNPCYIPIPPSILRQNQRLKEN